MDEVALAYLRSGPGQELLAAVSERYDGSNEHDALVASAALNGRVEDPALLAAALTQVRLRRRARQKFGADAEQMYFTADGLEQATTRLVADHRAARVATVAPGQVHDLGCGIGADLIAFARAGVPASGVDRDPAIVAVALANLQALGLPGAVRVATAEGQWASLESLDESVVFVDPARRSGVRRTFDPAAWSPPWSFVAEVLTRTAVAKTLPGLPHHLVPSGVEAEWVSLDGSLREAALWSGRLAGDVRRRATVMRSAGGGASATSVTDADDPGAVGVDAVGRYLYEPDDAVVRAHLVTAVAAQVSGWLLDDHIAYVSSNRLVSSPLARAYEVLAVLPYRLKLLRAALRERDVGAVTIKKRGVQVTPEELRKRLGLTGTQPATLVITRTPASAVALLVEPSNHQP